MPELIDVLAADVELGEGVALASAAPGLALVQVLQLGCGRWHGGVGRAALGHLILSGFLVRRLELAGRQSAELLGPGDLVRPTESDSDEYDMIPSHGHWQVLNPARLAVLDDRFARDAAAHPQVLERLMLRLLRRSQTLALRLALGQIPNLSSRIHFTLWHLADRFGKVERGGVLLPLPLTHALLAELVSAQRPSVTRALKQLERRGLVAHEADGWKLAGGAPSVSVPPAGVCRTAHDGAAVTAVTALAARA